MKATLAAVRGAFPGKRLLLAFQPHRFTRTRDLFEDFVKVLSGVDALALGDIYAAGEKPIPSISGQVLYEGIKKHGHKDVVYIADREKVLEHLVETIKTGDLVLTLGAGDIWKIGEQIMEKLKNAHR